MLRGNAAIGVATLTAALIAPLLWAPEAAGWAAQAPDPAEDAAWRATMERAVEATRGSAFRGRLVIVSFDVGGPSLAEVEVVKGPGGGMTMSRSAEAWLVGRSVDDAFYRSRAGNLLRLGNVERIDFDLEGLLTKYEVRLAGTRALNTGPATVLAIRERGAEQDREHLMVDEATNVVVRRETFDADGLPRRIVAFTDLTVTEAAIEGPSDDDAVVRGATRSVSEKGLRILDRTGWAVPHELPGDFDLQRGYALPDGEGSSLHLVYSDGLYTMSVYEQVGRMDHDAVAGATEVTTAELHVWRWPGSEPERVVWSSDQMTFTAISDAPLDTLLAAVEGLPADRPTGLAGRLLRGLQRVGSWLWPFDSTE